MGPALYSAGPMRIPQEHGAYARLSRPFLDLFVGGSGYETRVSLSEHIATVITTRRACRYCMCGDDILRCRTRFHGE